MNKTNRMEIAIARERVMKHDVFPICIMIVASIASVIKKLKIKGPFSSLSLIQTSMKWSFDKRKCIEQNGQGEGNDIMTQITYKSVVLQIGSLSLSLSFSCFSILPFGIMLLM